MEVDPSSDEQIESDVFVPSAGTPAEIVAHARQRHGVAGALLAGAMVGLQQVLDPRTREQLAVVVEAPGEPGDIDRTGITVASDDGLVVHTPPPGERPGMISQRSDEG